MAKKKVKNKKVSAKYKKYKIEAGKLIKGKSCPKCGPDTFLGIHKDREFCGKCHYTLFGKKG